MAKSKKPAPSTSKKTPAKKAAAKKPVTKKVPTKKAPVKKAAAKKPVLKKVPATKKMSPVKKLIEDKKYVLEQLQEGKPLDKAELDKREINLVSAPDEHLKDIEESKKALEEFIYNFQTGKAVSDNSLYPTPEHVEEPVKETMSIEPDAITIQEKFVSPGVFTFEKDEDVFIGQYPDTKTEGVAPVEKGFVEKNKNLITLFFGAILIVIFFALISNDSKPSEVEIPVVSDTTKITIDTPVLLIPSIDSVVNVVDTSVVKNNEASKPSSYLKDSLAVEALKFQKPIKLSFETRGETLVTYYTIGDSLVKITKTVRPNFK